MRQLGLLLYYGLLLMNSMIFAAAQTETPDHENSEPDCVKFTKIARRDIAISWNKTCFNNATSYKVELVTDQDTCPYNNIPCEGESLCETSIQDMGCSIYVNPCDSVTMEVTGGGTTKSISTNLAPYFKNTDWKFNVLKTNNNNVVNVTWGPPDNSESVRCATKAKVVGTCKPKQGDQILKETKEVDDISPDTMEIIQFNITDCKIKETYEVTVTYMSGNETTETTNSTQYKDTRSGVPEDRSLRLSGGEIAGITCGCLALVGIIGGVIYFIKYKKMLCFKD